MIRLFISYWFTSSFSPTKLKYRILSFSGFYSAISLSSESITFGEVSSDFESSCSSLMISKEIELLFHKHFK